MSKRILAVALALGILATSNAFASRSRNTVLGTGEGGLILNSGTFFYDDARNMFYNPAYVNDFKNWGVIEKSNFTGVTGVGTSAEGGFVSSIGTFNLGFFLNRVISENNSVANMASMNLQRPIEVTFGSDMGNAKWGLGVGYATFHTAANGGQNDTNVMIRAGLEVADFEPFGWATFGNETAAAGGTSSNTYRSYAVGLRYKMGEWLPYAAWREDQAPTLTNASTKNDAFIVGLGRTTKIGEGARMNYAIAFAKASVNQRTVIPMDVSVEADANSWLTARAGFTHNIYDRTSDSQSGDNSSARVGFGVHIGKADLDFTVAKAATAFAQAEEAGGLTSQVADISNGFFSQMSVGYHW